MAGTRCFVAIELPDATRMALAAVQRELDSAAPPQTVRWTRPESIHLTLQFLGDVPPGQIDAVADALRDGCRGKTGFTLDLQGIGVFPNPRRPRIVWVGVSEPTGALAARHREVGRALSPLGFPSEERPFQPHLTIGRAARHASGRDLAELGDEIVKSDVDLIGQVVVDHVSLMKSELRPAGALYTAQAVVSLEAR
jgi:2'-5' RNA ligase